MRLFSRSAMLLSLAASLPLTLSAQTLEEVIDGYIETSGGMTAMQSVETAKATGNMVMGAGLEAPFVIYFQPPEQRMRLEFEIQGMTAVQAYDGENGWAILPFLGKTTAEPMAEDQLKQTKDQADFFGPLINYKDKGHSLELVGTEDMQGTEAYHIKVDKANGDVEDWYLDTEYNLPFRVESSAEIQGQQVQTVQTYGDYKEVGDLVMAHSISVQFGPGGQGGQQNIVIEQMSVNEPQADNLFAMPEAEPEAEAESAPE